MNTGWIAKDRSERRFARLKDLVSTVRSCPSAPPFPKGDGLLSGTVAYGLKRHSRPGRRSRGSFHTKQHLPV
jgi:hypothetical protein